MRLLSSEPTLWFLFLFNLAVCLAAGIALHSPQRLAICAGMGVVSLGAGTVLFSRRPRQS
jgi:hypothetical protein